MPKVNFVSMLPKLVQFSALPTAIFFASGQLSLAETASAPVKVTSDNFARAESDLYFGRIVKDGGFGQFNPTRNLPAIDNQTIIRLNRDTLYSAAVVDLDAGPVTLTVPDAGGRFLSIQVINEDHFTPLLIHDAGEYVLKRDEIGTRYAMLGVRILVDPNDPEDVKVVNGLQDKLALKQSAKGNFEAPDWDHTSQQKVREHLLGLASMLPDANRMFGTKEEVEPVRHLIGTAFGWGGNPEKEATYLNVTPEKNDGKSVYNLTVGDVPVDGFWSISVYNADGYFEANPLDRYTINSITAAKDSDGKTNIQFGDCAAETPNCIPVPSGWNYTVRLYRPQQVILDGSWKFPEAEVIQ